MGEAIKYIFLSGLGNQEDDTSIEDGVTDVIVSFENGEKYAASFFSYQAITRLGVEHETSGAFLNGKYFWSDNMLLIKECNRPIINEVIDSLLDEGDFNTVFKKL